MGLLEVWPIRHSKNNDPHRFQKERLNTSPASSEMGIPYQLSNPCIKQYEGDKKHLIYHAFSLKEQEFQC